uniref:MARTX n=1 Tax=Ganoderma boninense TaxID=34458 RepID=A0A5K1JZR5_9APHY|nr:MARTX [Ganoderma boninense]
MAFPFPPVLEGAEPGCLDPTQRDRLLSNPNSRLSFALYDPLTATGVEHVLGNFQGEPQRIVIETPFGNDVDGHWRFVPPARRAPGVLDEGYWPRVVIINGEIAILSQEQWDIYKLDPVYDCYVPGDSESPTINRKVVANEPPSASEHRRHNPTTDPSNSDDDNPPSRGGADPAKVHKEATSRGEQNRTPATEGDAPSEGMLSASEAAWTAVEDPASYGRPYSPSEAAWTAYEGDSVFSRGGSPTEDGFSVHGEEAPNAASSEYSSSESTYSSSEYSSSPSEYLLARSERILPRSERVLSPSERASSSEYAPYLFESTSPLPLNDMGQDYTVSTPRKNSFSLSEDEASIETVLGVGQKDLSDSGPPTPSERATSVERTITSPPPVEEDATESRPPTPSERATSRVSSISGDGRTQSPFEPPPFSPSPSVADDDVSDSPPSTPINRAFTHKVSPALSPSEFPPFPVHNEYISSGRTGPRTRKLAGTQRLRKSTLSQSKRARAGTEDDKPVPFWEQKACPHPKSNFTQNHAQAAESLQGAGSQQPAVSQHAVPDPMEDVELMHAERDIPTGGSSYSSDYEEHMEDVLETGPAAFSCSPRSPPKPEGIDVVMNEQDDLLRASRQGKFAALVENIHHFYVRP